MPTSTNVSKYPEGMLDVIESVCETGKPCDIAFPDTKLARNERLRFYGLIRALFITKHSLAEKASKLELKLYGQDRKHPNILRIGFPIGASNDFYKTIAEKHNKSATSPNTPE